MGVVVRRYIDILIIIITFPYSTCITVSVLIIRRSKILIFPTQRNIRNLVGRIATQN